jgi:hypothetical protein
MGRDGETVLAVLTTLEEVWSGGPFGVSSIESFC